MNTLGAHCVPTLIIDCLCPPIRHLCIETVDRWAAVLAASIGVKVQACLRLAQNQGIPESRDNQFGLLRLTGFPAHNSAAE
jgi:hypothetical protein